MRPVQEWPVNHDDEELAKQSDLLKQMVKCENPRFSLTQMLGNDGDHLQCECQNQHPVCVIADKLPDGLG